MKIRIETLNPKIIQYFSKGSTERIKEGTT